MCRVDLSMAQETGCASASGGEWHELDAVTTPSTRSSSFCCQRAVCGDGSVTTLSYVLEHEEEVDSA